MEKCTKCYIIKITPKSKCLCGVKPFDEKKLSKVTKEPKEQKPIAKISEKKKERLKNKGSEIKKFKEIALKRQNNGKVYCEKCNKDINLEDLTHWNFDHNIPKSKGEEFRLNEKNIKILCVKCHFEKTNSQKLKINYKN